MPANFIQELTASLTEVPKQPLGPETRFREQPWWDSLAALVCMASFQNVYRRQLTAEQLRSCTTLADIVRLGTQ